VIRFKCIYCGQKIWAREEGRGKKGLCPKCKHNLFVPETTVNRPAISVDKASSSSEPVLLPKKHIPESDKEPYKIFEQQSLGSSDEMTEIYEEKPGFLVPNYDELTLFLTAVTFVILFFTNVTLQNDISRFLMRLDVWRRYIYVILFMAGVFMCLYHVFTKRKKTDLEKGIMLLFAVTINAATGIIAGVYMIKESAAWLLIFPIWNIANSLLMILMQYANIFDVDCIADRNATSRQVILGLVTVLIIFTFCNFIFKMNWAITFSICIIYATSFDRALQSVFPGISNEEDEQAL
jgi:hypothetical protein